MDNNDRLIRIRYALDIKNPEMQKIFGLGGLELSIEYIEKLLIKSKDRYFDSEGKQIEADDKADNIECSNHILESFLNGLIIDRRGVREEKPGAPIHKPFIIKEHASTNNVMLKKLRIALSLTSDDVVSLIGLAGTTISKSELGAFSRKRTNPKYVECGDKYARNFLKGLAIKYRKN